MSILKYSLIFLIIISMIAVFIAKSGQMDEAQEWTLMPNSKNIIWTIRRRIIFEDPKKLKYKRLSFGIQLGQPFIKLHSSVHYALDGWFKFWILHIGKAKLGCLSNYFECTRFGKRLETVKRGVEKYTRLFPVNFIEGVIIQCDNVVFAVIGVIVYPNTVYLTFKNTAFDLNSHHVPIALLILTFAYSFFFYLVYRIVEMGIEHFCVSSFCNMF